MEGDYNHAPAAFESVDDDFNEHLYGPPTVGPDPSVHAPPVNVPPAPSKKPPHPRTRLAQTAEDIYRDYPFAGTLLRNDGVRPTYMRSIPEARPQRLSTSPLPPGDYLLEVIIDEEDPIHIYFSIDDGKARKSDDSSQATSKRTEKRIANLEDDLQATRRRLTDEIDEWRGMYGRLQIQYNEVEAKSEAKLRAAQERHADEVRALESRIADLRTELTEARMGRMMDNQLAELREQYGNPEGASDEMKMLMMQQGMAYLGQVLGFNPGAIPNPQQPTDQAPTDQDTPDEADLSDDEAPTQPDPNTMVQDTAQTLFNLALKTALDKRPDLEAYAETVGTVLCRLTANGGQIDTAHWVQIIIALASEAVKKKIGPAKLVDVILPYLEGLGQYKALLSTMPASQAAKTLIATFAPGVEVDEAARTLLIKVLQALKKKL